eukprot:TRINITY_DN22868_c0_g1_i1.p1 TRINITY_DN22868_c0_g1~~TRINITY_DN22868_c0_g1_i1.p1  ORF type:complete len:240 (-),score=45.50 TRINITY_DN22868_c0_g1_i1:414-1133(-)
MATEATTLNEAQTSSLEVKATAADDSQLKTRAFDDCFGTAQPALCCAGEPSDKVLAWIKQAQDGNLKLPGYETALREIRSGRKISHWIWYIWPTIQSLRPNVLQPSFLLPDMAAAQAYLRDDTLVERLVEITQVAIDHLDANIQPRVLFGNSIDASKFVETMTFFAVAAVENGQAELVEVFLRGVRSTRRSLDARSMQLAVEIYGRPKYGGVSKADQLAQLAPMSSAAEPAPFVLEGVL